MASGPITSWQIDGKKVETVTDFIFLGSIITADDDCSCKINRHLLLERQAMTNVSSVVQSCMTLRTHVLQHAKLPFPSPSPRVFSNSCPLSWWCHPNISSSFVPFSSCPQSFSASGSFPVSQHFTSGGQSIRASASASVLPINIQGWFPLGLTDLISLQSKRLSRVFSSITVCKVSILQCSAFFIHYTNTFIPCAGLPWWLRR